jgi:regulator of sigma E protease
VDLLYFVILVSTLIFVHELGHFAFAKIFGVKVLTFSIGFGPKLLKIRGKETEYALALLPFGGFVKMLEAGRGEQILPEDRPRTFEAQALWKRIVIVLAGPAMNLLFPILLYTSVYLEDRFFLPATVGVVVPGKPADGKLRAGDVIASVDGAAVSSFPEVQRAIAKRIGQPTKLVVQRDGKEVEVVVTPADEIEVLEPRELDLVEHVGRIGIVPSFPAPVIGVPRPDSPAYRAGLRTFDRITAINGRKVERFFDVVTALSQNKGDTVVLTYLRPVSVPRALGGLCELAVMDAGVATLTPLARDAASSDVPGASGSSRAGSPEDDVLRRTGIESSDLYVAFVPEGSSEWRAGLRAGDRVTMLDGRPQRLWMTLKEEVLRSANQPHELEWTRDGQPMRGTFQVRKESWEDGIGQHYERYVFRTTHWLPSAPEHPVPNPSPLFYAIRRGLEETGAVIKFILVGFVRILQGRVSLSTVSGPITMYDVAGQAGAKGTTYFVWAMALISLNLGLINLLPIPVLDGGHLLFFVIEGVRRRPLPLRAREVASLVGMGVLVLLMLLAFKNDVERRWDVIVGQVREIFG